MIKRGLLGLVISATMMIATPAVAMTEADVMADIKAFQGYFKKKFPGVALADYVDGVNALPAYSERRANWELLMEFPPV